MLINLRADIISRIFLPQADVIFPLGIYVILYW